MGLLKSSQGDGLFLQERFLTDVLVARRRPWASRCPFGSWAVESRDVSFVGKFRGVHFSALEKFVFSFPVVCRLKMGEEIDQAQFDLRDIVSRIVEMLTSGRSVCLSNESSCAVLASALENSIDLDEGEERTSKHSVLLHRDVASARDFLAETSPVAKRLMSKCWPGSVRLVFRQELDERLLSQLSPSAQRSFQAGNGLCLCVPSSPLLHGVLQQVPFPLLRVELDKKNRNRQSGLTIVDSDSQSIESEAEIHIDGDRWELVKPSGLRSVDVARMTTTHYLFICTGNTCRSPMAEAIFRQLLAERFDCDESRLGEHGFEIGSAGLAAGVGAPASPESVEVCRVHGVDLTHHASQPLTEELLLAADKVFTMTEGHRESILSRYPELESLIELLSRNGQDVSDPIGWGMAAYQQCHHEISESLQALVEELTNKS